MNISSKWTPKRYVLTFFYSFSVYIYLLLHLLNAFAIFFTAVSDFENSDDDDLNFIATSQSTEHDDEGGGDSNANNLSRESSTGSNAGNRFDQSTRLKPLDSNPPLRKLGGFIDEDEKSKKKKKKTKKKKTKKAKSADVVRFVSDATDGW